MLLVHRSERADRLVDALGEILSEPLADPMTNEVVAVPTRGVERWLAQRLSHRLGTGAGGHDGVCANIAFPFPGVLIGQSTAAACGIAGADDPWLPERMVWPLVELVDAHLGEAFLAPLAVHLQAASPPAPGGQEKLRRFATVRHLADLYDHYGVHRPEMVRAWAAGSDGAGATAGNDGGAGVGGDGRPGDPWQAELWRRLRRRIGVDSPAERLEGAVARIGAEPKLLDLPPRLSLFGLTRLPASYLDVLGAIAGGRDVHLFLLHPSPVLWAKVASAAPHPVARLPRRSDPTSGLPDNPLLRSWGRDAREMQVVLAAHGTAASDDHPASVGAAGGGHHPLTAGEGGRLLQRVQDDIRADRAPPGRGRPGQPDPRPALDPGDDSLRIHACHGRSRQVEVMRDAILHLLADDPSLEPRDIVVMCPDIEAFAPLVQATFGAGDQATAGVDGAVGSDPLVRVRLADRSLRQTNPLLGVAAHLMELAGSRVTASQVLDLASREPVRRRFRFDDNDLSHVERWVVDMGVRWGLDADHRRPWGLGGLAANTWASGLDRLMLGVAVAEDGQKLFGGALPLDDVTSGTVDLAGRLAEMVHRLHTAVRQLSVTQPVERWAGALAGATESLAVAAPADAWQHDQLHRALTDVVTEAAGAGPGAASAGPGAASAAPLDLSEARSLLARRLQGRPTRANFRTGDLTVCTLVPMRSVPHRVVCLLGLDDGTFPRHTERDGDDLLLDDPRVGDRDARGEDRQLLLDALLAATERLVITYCGRDERTNHPRPPAVPVAELLDVVDSTVRLGDGNRPARRAVVVHHPLQPFDPVNFVSGALGAGRWSFDGLQLAGARALCGDRHPPAPFLAGPLAPPGARTIALESLVKFVEHPVKSFLRERLGVYAGRDAGDVDDRLPIELDGLGKWEVGDRLLDACLQGAGLDEAVAAERARGILPPGGLADAVLDEVKPAVAGLVDAVNQLPCAKAPAESVEVNVALPDGRRLIGTVPGVRDGTIVRCTYSRLGAKHRIGGWVRFLALSAARPDLPVGSATIGRGTKAGDQQRIAASEFDPLPGTAEQRLVSALDLLGVIVDLYDRGMREPLPLYCATSAAWAEAARALAAGASGDPVRDARDKWKSNSFFAGEDADASHVLALGGTVKLEELRQAAPGPGECGPGWDHGETTRLGRLARRLWDAPLHHERRAER